MSLVPLMMRGERTPLGYFWWGSAGDVFVTLLELRENCSWLRIRLSGSAMLKNKAAINHCP